MHPTVAPRHLPHERDEKPEPDAPARHGVIEQAAHDLERGLVDTDLHGTRGLPPQGAPQQAEPLPQREQGMRERKK